MTDTLRDRIVRVQAEHVEGQLTNYDTGREECGCGRQGSATYREHLADAILALPGIAVVELPGPDDGRDDWLDAVVRTGLPKGCPRSVDVELDPGTVIGLSVEYARDLAAALLAAADYAERER